MVVLDREVRAGGWDWKAAGELRRIRGTRLGVVGLGRTGRALVERASALGFEVWGTDPALDDDQIAATGARPARAPRPAGRVPCRLAARRADARRPTRSSAPTSSRSCPTAPCSWTRRAPQLVDLDALRSELESGRLGGAALDVIPVEPPTAEHPAPAWPRLVVTPHVAWYSAEAEEACYRRPVLSVRAVLEGRTPDGAVNSP